MYFLRSILAILWFNTFLIFVISRNQILRFAEIAAVTGPSAVLGNSFQLGLNDSFNEANSNNEIKGITLIQDLKDSQGKFSVGSQAMAEFINDIDNIFAFIGPTTLANSHLVSNYTTPNKIPLIGPLSGSMEFRRPFNPYVINLRSSTDDEAYAMIHYIVHRLLFTRIALFHCSDDYGMSGIQSLEQAMQVNAMTPHILGFYDSNNPSNITQAMKDKRLLPQIIIIRHYTDEVIQLITYVKTVYPSMKFFVFSSTPVRYIAGVVLGNGGGDTRYIDGIYSTIGTLWRLPFGPQYGTNGLSYRTPSGPIDVPSSTNTINISPFIKLEGYLVGRLIIDTLKRLPQTVDVTREAFTDMIYNSGGYDLGPGFKCGAFLWPASLHCADKDGCNQCSRQVKVYYSNITSMTMMEDVHGSAKFSTCGFRIGNRTFLHFGMTKPTIGPYAYQAEQIDAGIRSAFHEINLVGGLRGSKLVYTSLDHHDYDGGQENMDHLLNTFEVQSLLALSDREFIKYGKTSEDNPLIAGLSSSAVFRQPFDYSYLHFLPSDTHQYVVLIDYLFNTFGRMKVGLFTTNNEFGEATKHSLSDALSTRRSSLYIHGQYNISLGDYQTGLFSMITNEKNGDPQAIVVDGSPDIAGKFIAKARGVWKRCLFILSSDSGTEDALQFYTLALTNSENTDQSNVKYDRIYAIQSLPHPLNTSMRAVIDYRNSLAALDEGLNPSFYSLYGYLAAKMTAYLFNNDEIKNIHDIEFFVTTYQQAKFQMQRFPCGPFIATNNFTQGCSSCYQTTYIYPISSIGIIDSNPVFHRNHDTCMPTINSNVDFYGIVYKFCIGLSALSTLFGVIILSLLVFYRRYFLILPNFKFSLLSCIGAILSFINLSLQYGPPTNQQCLAETLLGNFSFVFVFGPIFAKTSRLHQIFNNKKLRKLRITDRAVLGRFLLMFSYFLAYNIAWISLDPPKIVEVWTYEGVRYEECTYRTKVFTTIDTISQFVCYFYGVFLCTRIRGIKGEWAMFNESKEIGTSIYVGTFLLLIQFALQSSLKNGYEHSLSGALFDVLTSLTVLWILIVPPIYKAYKRITREQFVAKCKADEQLTSSDTTDTHSLHPSSRITTERMSGTVVNRRSTTKGLSGITMSTRSSIAMSRSSIPKLAPGKNIRVVGGRKNS